MSCWTIPPNCGSYQSSPSSLSNPAISLYALLMSPNNLTIIRLSSITYWYILPSIIVLLFFNFSIRDGDWGGCVDGGCFCGWVLGVVSLTFHELSKIISRKYTILEITFMVRISSWNFVRVLKAWLWAQLQSFSLKFSWELRFLQYTIFKRISWRARETLVKQPPGPHALFSTHPMINTYYVASIGLYTTCTYIEGILPIGPYLPCVSMAGRAVLAGYPRYDLLTKWRFDKSTSIRSLSWIIRDKQ